MDPGAPKDHHPKRMRRLKMKTITTLACSLTLLAPLALADNPWFRRQDRRTGLRRHGRLRSGPVG